MTDAIRVYHQFRSAKAGSGDPTKVQPTNWNEDLVVVLAGVLKALSALATSPGQIPFLTGTETAGVIDTNAFTRALLGSADATAFLAAIAGQPLTANLTAEAGLIGADGMVSYYTGPGAKALFATGAYMRSLMTTSGAAALIAAIGALSAAGGTMSGDLDMATHKVTGLAAPSGASDAATKAYVDALATLVSGALVFKGDWDPASGAFPGGGAAQKGWFYKVSADGTFGGKLFTAGDDIYALVNNASTTTYASNWLQIQGTITLAEIQAAIGFTFGSLAQANSITASLISDASANARSFLQAADYAAMRTLLGLGALATAAIASQAEAEAGTDNAKGMTPLRTAQAIAAQMVVNSGRRGVSGLFGNNSGITPNSIMSFYFAGNGGVTLVNPTTGVAKSITFGSSVPVLNCDITVAGPAANGRDQVAAFANSSWVHFYLIWNGTALATLCSAASADPTLPSGYTHCAYLGAVYKDSSGNLARVYARGSKFFYVGAQPGLAAGNATTETAINLAAAVPPNALTILLAPRLFKLTATAGGVADGLVVLRVVSGSLNVIVTGNVYFSGIGASAVVSSSPGAVEVPNNSQQIFYMCIVTSGSSPQFTMDVEGYTVPNGGE